MIYEPLIKTVASFYTKSDYIHLPNYIWRLYYNSISSTPTTANEYNTGVYGHDILCDRVRNISHNHIGDDCVGNAIYQEESSYNSTYAHHSLAEYLYKTKDLYYTYNHDFLYLSYDKKNWTKVQFPSNIKEPFLFKRGNYYYLDKTVNTAMRADSYLSAIYNYPRANFKQIITQYDYNDISTPNGYIGHNGYLHFSGSRTIQSGYTPVKLADSIQSVSYWTNLKPTINTTNYAILFTQLVACSSGLIRYRIVTSESAMYTNTVAFLSYTTGIAEDLAFLIPISVQYMYINYAYTQVFNKLYIFTTSGKIYTTDLEFNSNAILLDQTFNSAFMFIINDKQNKKIYAFQQNGQYIDIDFNNSYDMGKLTLHSLGLDTDELILDHSSTLSNHYISKTVLADKYILTSKKLIAINLASGLKIDICSNSEYTRLQASSSQFYSNPSLPGIQLLNFDTGKLSTIFLKTINYNLDNMMLVYSHHLDSLFGMTRHYKNIYGVNKLCNNRIIIRVGVDIYELVETSLVYLGTVLNIASESFYTEESGISKIEYLPNIDMYYVLIGGSSSYTAAYFTTDFISFKSMLECFGYNDRLGYYMQPITIINNIGFFIDRNIAILPNITKELKLPTYTQTQLTTNLYSVTPICSFSLTVYAFSPTIQLNITGDTSTLMFSVRCLNPTCELYGNTYYSTDPYEYFCDLNSATYFEHYDWIETLPGDYVRQYQPGMKQLVVTIYAKDSVSVNFNGSLQSIIIDNKLIKYPFNELYGLSFTPDYIDNKVLFYPLSYTEVSDYFGFNFNSYIGNVNLISRNGLEYFELSYNYDYSFGGLEYLYSSYWENKSYYRGICNSIAETRSGYIVNNQVYDAIPSMKDLNLQLINSIGNRSFEFDPVTQVFNFNDFYTKLPDRINLVDSLYFKIPNDIVNYRQFLLLASDRVVYFIQYITNYGDAVGTSIIAKKSVNFDIIKLTITNSIIFILGNNTIAWSIGPDKLFTELLVSDQVTCIEYFSSKYIVGSINGIVTINNISEQSYTFIQIPEINRVIDIIVFNSTLYLLDDNGVIVKSNDGATFSRVITGLDFTQICFGKSSDSLLVGGTKGKLACTSNGIDWHFIETNITNNIVYIDRTSSLYFYCYLAKNIINVKAFIESFDKNELFIEDKTKLLDYKYATDYELVFDPSVYTNSTYNLVNIIPWSSKFKEPKIALYLDSECTKPLSKSTFYSGELYSYQGPRYYYYNYSWSDYYGIGYTTVDEITFKFPLEPGISITYVVCSLTMNVIEYSLKGVSDVTDPVLYNKLNAIQHFDAFTPVSLEKEFSFVASKVTTDDKFMYVTCNNTRELKDMLVNLTPIYGAETLFKGRVIGCSMPTTFIDFLEPLGTDTHNELNLWLKQTDNSVYYDNITIISRLINKASNIQPKLFLAKPISEYYNYYYDSTESCIHNNSLAITDTEASLLHGQFLSLYKNGLSIEFVIAYCSGTGYQNLTGFSSKGFPDVAMYNWFNRKYYKWPASDTEIHYFYSNQPSYPVNNMEFLISQDSKLCIAGYIVNVSGLEKISTLPLAYKGTISLDSIDLASLLFNNSLYSAVGSIMFGSDVFKSLGSGNVNQTENGYTVISIDATKLRSSTFCIMYNSKVFLDCIYISDNKIGIKSTAWYTPSNSYYYTPVDYGTFEIFYIIYKDYHAYSSTGSQEMYLYESGTLEFNSNDNDIWSYALDISDIRYNVPKQLKIRHSGVNAFSTLELLNTVRIAGIEYK